ncbi:MAG: response regulator [Nitrosotalea sp.]|jgi:two-component system, chemotaxis family, chemotaxis protein CheY|nr:response regulator [Aquella sp.]
MSVTNNVKFLIVDDASFMRIVLKDILISHGLASQIYEAGDGVAAVEAYKQFKPDVVTMDVNMPKADGLQALQSILRVNPRAKVVMVTAVEQKHVIQDAMKAGARDYVVKPFDRANVALVMSKVIRAR